MEPAEIQPLLWGFLGGIISIAGTAIAISNWLNARFELLRTRQQETETRLQIELERLKGSADVGSSRELSHFDLLDYKCNGNRELIEHRTTRFFNELKAVEGRLMLEIDDVKGFLEKTTDFQIRTNRQPKTTV